MSTAAMPPEALDLLQQYSIDVKDFTKASVRYKTVLTEELVPQSGGSENAEVIAATEEAQEKLKEAWQEYLGSVQLYFNRLAKGLVADLVASHDAANAPPPPPPEEKEKGKAGSSVLSSSEVVFSTSEVSRDVPKSQVAQTSLGEPPAAAAAAALTSLVLPVVQHIPAPGAVGLAGSAHPLHTSPSSPLGGSVNSSSARQSGAWTQAPGNLSLPQRAEKMNDLCALLDKWYVRNERTFQLPDPEGIARMARDCVSSASRLLRLLGLRIAYVCAGNATFLRTFVEAPDAAQWVGLCGDRELLAEVEGLLNLMERMVALVDEDAKAYPRIPFGWLYRVCAILDPQDPAPNITPKRRSQAIRVALQLLQVSPAQATAASMHSTLLRSCLVKGGATPEETAAILHVVLDMFDTPKSRQYLKISDISIIFAPFLETTTATTPAAVQDNITSLNLAKDIIVNMLSTWVGSLWISCETTALRALIDVLHLPGDLDKKMVIFSLFNSVLVRLAPHRGILEMEPWGGTEADRRRRAAAAATNPVSPADWQGGSNNTFPNSSSAHESYAFAATPDDMDGDDDFVPTTKALGYHVRDTLLGRVLVALSFHGLPMALMDMLQNTKKNRITTEAASRLLQDLFVLMDTVLPKSTVRSLHEAFNSAVGRLSCSSDQFLGDFTSQLFHSYKTSKGMDSRALLDGGSLMMLMAANASQATNSAFGTLDMDDPTFISLLKETRVEQYPMDFTAWDCDRLLTLVQGPLRVIRRLRAAKGILKTLVAFYSPRDTSKMFFMRTFSSLKAEEATPQLCALGIELVDLLLSTREGTVLLDDASFPQGVALMLTEVRTGNPRILTTERVNARCGQSLVLMTGRLSWYANGLILMREHNIFTIIDALFSKLRGQRVTDPAPEDTLHGVCYQLLQHLFLSAVPNYGVCEDIRHTFREALRSPSNAIRLCAAMQLRKAVWRDISTSLKWGIETLVQILHDDFYSVVESAFKLLLSICLCSDEGLDYLISLFPTVLMESEMILTHAKQLHLDVLLYRITSRPSGFRFLQSYGWIDKELHRWETSESVNYIKLVEKLQNGDFDLKAALNPTTGASRSGGRHTQSFSNTMGNMYKSGTSPASPTTGFLPLLTADTAMSANFFPVHFASVLCRSAEGCAMFKHSDLWTRSVRRILEQPLPPDIVYDDSLSDQSDLSEESDDDMNLTGETTHMVPVKPASLSAAGHDGYGGNSLGRGDNSFIQASLVNRRGTGGAAGSATVVGGAGGAGSFTNASALGGNNASTTSAAAMNSAGQVGNLAANGQQQAAHSTGAASGVTRHGNGIEEPPLTAGEMRQLQSGKLSRNSAVLLSAARGYKSLGRAFSMDCVGDALSLKDAIMVICQVGSGNAGHTLIRTTPELQKRLTTVCRFASTMSVRCMGLVGVAILARSRRATDELERSGYSVYNNMNAYVSAEGIPYAVAFAHMKPSKSMSIARKVIASNTAARQAYADYTGIDTTAIPRKICESVVALANPVSREAAKAFLYKVMKRHPHAFTSEQTRRLCLDASSTYRMRHVERKFLADLIENAQIAAAAAPKPRHGR